MECTLCLSELDASIKQRQRELQKYISEYQQLQQKEDQVIGMCASRVLSGRGCGGRVHAICSVCIRPIFLQLSQDYAAVLSEKGNLLNCYVHKKVMIYTCSILYYNRSGKVCVLLRNLM